MKRPDDWENTQAYGEFEPLELGGHICRIMKVEETKSSTNMDMLKIFVDIAEGEQKGYYAEQYRRDNRPDKKWGCIVYQLLEDRDGNTNRGFKTFVNAVEKSNISFDTNKIWDEHFCDYFKDKLIGGVFGREQYKNNNGEFKWSTKCVQFRDVETIRRGVTVPEDKYHKDYTTAAAVNPGSFTVIDDDGDLPF